MKRTNMGTLFCGLMVSAAGKDMIVCSWYYLSYQVVQLIYDFYVVDYI